MNRQEFVKKHQHDAEDNWVGNDSAPGHILWMHSYFEHGYAYKTESKYMLVNSAVLAACLVCKATWLDVGENEWEDPICLD